ncbi:MAG: FecR domain-containing protein [Flavipsychrobacter sp.]|nr:FecR domain-containing protein [Flavipsychrobacter sp.]
MENRIQQLLSKLRDNTLSNDDWNDLLMFLEDESLSEEVVEVMTTMIALETPLYQLDPDLSEAIRDRIGRLREPEKIQRVVSMTNRTGWWKVAVAIVLLSLGWYIFQARNSPSELRQKELVNNDTEREFLPAQQGAILLLANGNKLVLDSVQKGDVLAVEQGVDLKMADGELSYRSQGASDSLTYNTLITPKGRQFSVLLADGTRAWLNANSSLHYPVAFGSSARAVKAVGEVYFEVAADKKRPFKVEVDGKMWIEVLGTHFNMSAYENESSIATTLLEGSVVLKTLDGLTNRQIRPGQQAVLNRSEQGPFYVKNDVDIERVMAWKNGKFDFDGLKVEDAMRVIERWYDIKVKYQNGVPDITFYGELNRDIPLSDLLMALKDSKLRFKMDGSTLIILK